MFGINKKKIEEAFDEFANAAGHFSCESHDPWVRLIVKFILDLRKAFN